MLRGDRECKMESPTTDHSPFCGEDYEHIHIPDPDPRSQSPEPRRQGLSEEEEEDEYLQREKAARGTCSQVSKQRPFQKQNIEGKRDYSLQTHSKDLYNRRKRSKSGKKEMKVPHTELKKCASKRRLSPFNL